MKPTVWRSLVTETQFATELTVTGLRRLCSVPTGPTLLGWHGSDLDYALHVGLYSYSSGLERLCKLAIACNRYAATGQFPKLRGYEHRITTLLDAVEALTPTGPGTSTRKTKYLTRPVDKLDPDLTNAVERFATGAGRYEHLDSLWNDDVEVNSYNEWCELASKASVSKKVRELMSLREAVDSAITSELVEVGLEAAAGRVTEDLDVRMFEPSVGVVLSLFRKVRWVSTVLDEATSHQARGLPVLGEVVSPAFIHSPADFFNFHIARVGDVEVVVEELDAVYPRIRAREAKEDDESDEDICVEE